MGKSNASIYFGCSFFRCVRVSRLKKTNNTEQIDLMLGISENGVIFVNPTTLAIIERYKMEEILTYGFRSNAFLFVAGTLMTQRKYQFATMLGKQMNDCEHILISESNKPKFRDTPYSIKISYIFLFFLLLLYICLFDAYFNFFFVRFFVSDSIAIHSKLSILLFCL